MDERPDCSGCVFGKERVCQALRRGEGGSRGPACGTRRLARDEMIYEIGTRPGLMGILSKGYLRRERVTRDGRRTVLGLLSPGDVVGEMPDRPASYSLEAATEAEIRLFSVPLAKRLANGDPEFRRGITADLERQYDHELTFACLRLSMQCRERVIAFLVIAAELLPVEPQADGSVIFAIPFGRRDWADLCNTTVESISRQLADLATDGLVEFLGKRRYRLRDLQALRKVAGRRTIPAPGRTPSRRPGVNTRIPAMKRLARKLAPVV